MKRIVSFLFAVIMILGFMFSAAAAGTEKFYLDEVGMTISIPNEFYVFTKNTKADYPGFALFGYTKESLLKMMSSINCILFSQNAKGDTGVSIAVTKADNPDLNTLDDNELEALCRIEKESFTANGAIVTKSDIYKQSQTVFQRMIYKLETGTDFSNCIQYSTVLDGDIIVVQFQVYSRGLTSADESAMKGIVDSIRFDLLTPSQASSKASVSSQKTSSKTSSAVSKTSSVASTTAFTFTDSETQTTFTVPSNWSKKSLSKTRQYIDTKFVYNQDSEGIIMYGSTDLWAEMSDADKIAFSRADFNNDLFTAADLAEAMNVNADQVKTVNYNDISYYKIVTSVPIEIPANNASVTMTLLLHVDNGYLYAFYYNGTSSSPYYKDFEALLRSVKYAEPIIMSSTPSQAASSVSSTPTAVQSGQSDGGNSVWAVVITLLIFAAPIIIYRYAIAKKPIESRKALMITIFYGFGVAAVTALLAVLFDIGFICIGVVVLWSFVNYLILTMGWQRRAREMAEKAQENVPAWKQYGRNIESKVQQQEPNVNQISTQKAEIIKTTMPPPLTAEPKDAGEQPQFCENCGKKLKPDTKFCPKCGAKVEKLRDE